MSTQSENQTRASVVRRLLLVAVLTAFLLASCTSFPLYTGSRAVSAAEHSNSSLVQTEEIIIALLLVAAVVSVVAARLRIPYTVGLVIIGLALTLIGRIPVLTVTPEIILAILVPPLIFEAAFHINFSELKKELPLILALAILGVVLTTFLVGGLVSLTAQLSLPTALVFGALISATDPVAVVSLFRTLGTPRRLQLLLEGESLFNDGTAIVIYNLMLGILLTGTFDLGQSLQQFVIVAGGGILVGGLAGIFVSRVIGRIDHYLVETTLTTVLAYGSYLVAEYVLGFSGVLAVVAAGLATGQLGPSGMSPTTRIVVFNFWEYAAFLANSFVFLIIGLQIDLDLLVSNAATILWAILAVLVARAVTVYGLSWIGKGIPIAWKSILFWGGLRGAISLALALSLTADIPHRAELQAMAFGVVLFTLLVEGLTMGSLVRRSGVTPYNLALREYETVRARAIALRSALAHLKKQYGEGLISEYTWSRIQPIVSERLAKLGSAAHAFLSNDPKLYEAELADTHRKALRAQRSALTGLFYDNVIGEHTYETLIAELDAELTDPESTWPGSSEAAS